MNPVNSSQRITVNEAPPGLEIVISANRNFYITLFYPFLIIIWGVVGYSIISNYFDGDNSSDKIPLLVGLVICSIFGAIIIHAWIYNLIGKERILINDQTLSVKLDIYGFGIRRKYDIRHVSNFRPEERRGSFTPFLPALYRKIVFDYKDDVCGFGIFYNEMEAQAITNILQRHHNVARRSLTPT